MTSIGSAYLPQGFHLIFDSLKFCYRSVLSLKDFLIKSNQVRAPILSENIKNLKIKLTNEKSHVESQLISFSSLLSALQSIICYVF